MSIPTTFPVHSEPVLTLDHEPIATRLSFRYNEIKTEEENTMNKTEFVTYCIQHSEYFPDVDEIDLETAETILVNLDPSEDLPSITPEEFVTAWNTLIHDPSVMDIE